MTRSLRTRSGALLLAGLLLAGACSGDDADSDDLGGGGGAASGDTEAALTTLADGVIIPAYEALAGRVDELRSAIDDLCEAPSTEALTAARSTWSGAQEAYGNTRAVMVGPATELRLMGDIGFRARLDKVDALVAGAEPVDPTALAEQGTAVRGLYAVEVLLFAPGAEVLATPDGARRCTYASSAAELSLAAADAVLEEWTAEDGYRTPFIEGPEGDPMMSVGSLVGDASFRLQEVDDLGLRDLIGVFSVEDLDDARRDGPSASRLTYLRSVLDGVTAVLLGPDGDGLRALLEARSADTAERLTELIRAAQSALGQLPDSVAESLGQQDAVSAAADAVAALKVLVTTELASQLGVTIGFSDADGDS